MRITSRARDRPVARARRYVAATNDNFVATSGEIDISAITATTITGGASFAFDADNSVNGQFTATICP